MKRLKLFMAMLFLCFSSFISYSSAQISDLSHMKFAFLFAMPEEAKALEAIGQPLEWKDYLGYKVAEFKYKDHDCVAFITGVGKSLSAGAAAIALSKYEPDAIINIGSAGGINCEVGDIILSQSALFHDVNMSAINLEIHRLPDLPRVIKSKHNLVSLLGLYKKVGDEIKLRPGMVVSGDQFMHRTKYIHDLGVTYPNAKAIEMEGASIAAICYRAGVDFLLIKKISNRADNEQDNKDDKFSSEIKKFKDKSGDLVLAILNS